MNKILRIFVCMGFIVTAVYGTAVQATTWDFNGVVDFCNPTACNLGGVVVGDAFRGYVTANSQPNSTVGPGDITGYQVFLGDLSAGSADSTVVSSDIQTDGNGDFLSGTLVLEGTISGVATLTLTFDVTGGDWIITTDFLGIGTVASGPGDWGFEADGDDIGAIEDNCIETFNPDQRDTDTDGFGNDCDGDFDQNCLINFADLQSMSFNFFAPGDLDTDLNGDNITNFLDLQIMEPLVFGPPGPSGVPNICDP